MTTGSGWPLGLALALLTPGAARSGGPGAFVQEPRDDEAAVRHDRDPSYGIVFGFCGDANGDRCDDYAIAGRLSADGVVTLHSGRDGEVLRTLTPEEEWSRFGAGMDLVRTPHGSELVVSCRSEDSSVLSFWSPTTGELTGHASLPRACGGTEVLSVADLDGDGWDDVVALCDQGNVCVTITSRERKLAHTFGVPGDPACSEGRHLHPLGRSDAGPLIGIVRRGIAVICRVDETGVHELMRIETEYECVARSMTIVPDLDGDGVADVAIGYPLRWTAKGIGSVAFHSGSDGRLLSVLKDPEGLQGFGAAIAMGGDVDGDGRNDLIVSRHQVMSDAVIAFRTDEMRPIETMGRPGGGAEPPDLGWSVRVGGDCDGDGVADLLVGRYEPRANGCSGQGVVVVSGRGMTLLREHLLE